MAKHGLAVVLGLFLAMGASPIAADSWVVSHSCYKPFKPFEFTDQWQLDNFNFEVEQYRYCIEEFVEEQEYAIRRHEQAAEEAIDEWNNFVRYELN